MLTISAQLVSSSSSSRKIHVDIGVDPSQAPGLKGYTTYQFELKWNTALAFVDSSSIKLIGNSTNGDVSAYDTKAVATGTIKAGGWSGNGNFSGTTKLLSFDYTQSTLDPVNFVIGEERFDNINYLSNQGNLNVLQVALNAAGQVIPAPPYEAIAPTINGFTPSSTTAVTALDSNLTINFSEKIVKGSGTIELRSGSAQGTIVESFNVATSTRLNIAENNLTIDPQANLTAGTSYFVVIPSSVVFDASGNALASGATYSFTTVAADKTPPSLVSATPSSVTVTDLGTNLIATFSEPITPKKGTIELRLGNSTGALVQAFDAETSNRLSFNGATLSINPSADLLAGNGYSVVIPAGSLADAAGNLLATKTSFSFTTSATAAMVDADLNPALRAVSENSKLNLVQLQAYLPTLKNISAVSQYKLGDVLVLKTLEAENTSPTGKVSETVIAPSGAQVTSGDINDQALHLNVNLPSGIHLSSSGPSAPITALQSKTYFFDLLEKFFPTALISPEVAAYKAIVMDCINDLGSHITEKNATETTTYAARLITPSGNNVIDQNLRLTGNASENDFSVLNLFNLSGNTTVEVSDISNLLVVGAGKVTATGSACYLAGDISDQNLVGTSGNDTLNGGGGTDILSGGLGNDVFIIGPHDHVTLRDFSSGDIMNFDIPGIKSLSDLVSHVMAVSTDKQSVSYAFDTGLTVTLMGKQADSTYTLDMFAFSG